jgi:hypothetical protein
VLAWLQPPDFTFLNKKIILALLVVTSSMFHPGHLQNEDLIIFEPYV